MCNNYITHLRFFRTVSRILVRWERSWPFSNATSMRRNLLLDLVENFVSEKNANTKRERLCFVVFIFQKIFFQKYFKTKTKIVSLRKNNIFEEKKLWEKKKIFRKKFWKNKCLIISESNFLSKNIFQQIFFWKSEILFFFSKKIFFLELKSLGFLKNENDKT